VLPEISLDVVNRLQIINPSAEITESDLENMLVKLRIQKRTWQEVERDSQSGDLVTINFSGTSEGENFTNGKAENSKIEIGGRQMIPGFEEALLGLSTGAVKKFSATFPEQYHNTKLAGKAAEFEIEVVKVEEPVLPEINVEFIQSYGVESGDLETFRNEVKANMERELQQTLKTRLKNNVFDNLYEQIALALPKVMIDIEIEKMLQPLAAQAQKEHFNPQDIELPESLEAQAERRVALGLILSEIVKQNQLKIDAQKVRSFITELSKSYETPEEVINWYYADQNRLNEVQQMVLEDQAVDWVLSQAQVTTQSLSFSEVMDKQQIEV
jgi:trigger factor